MSVTINEVSGNTAQVVVDYPSFDAAATVEIELDEGFFSEIIDAYIAMGEFKLRDPNFNRFLSAFEGDINVALAAHYQEAAEDYADGRGDYLMERWRDAR